MENICEVIESRISDLEIISSEHLTPLLRTEICHAIKLHREALSHPPSYLKDLDDLFIQAKEHWAKSYGNLSSRVSLLRDIIMFHQFLVGKLLEDYANEPYEINKWVLDQAKCLSEKEGHAWATDGSNMDAYSVHVIFPLEEMMLSRDYIENKLLAVATGKGSDIQPLIDRCDWPNLATALTNDRDLAYKLFEEQPLDTNTFDENTYKRILRSIDGINKKYFAGQTSNYTNHGSLQTPQTIAPSNRHGPEGPSLRRGWARFCNAIAGSVEATSRINPEKTE